MNRIVNAVSGGGGGSGCGTEASEFRTVNCGRRFRHDSRGVGVIDCVSFTLSNSWFQNHRKSELAIGPRRLS